jgi:hypothetical protein
MGRLVAVIVLGAVAGGLAPMPATAEWFIDGYVGRSFTLDSDIEVERQALGDDFTVKDVTFDDESFKSPVYYGARIGYFLDPLPAFGLALEFFHFKILAETSESRRFTGTRLGAGIATVQPVNTVIQRFDVSHGVNYLTLDAIVRAGFLQDEERFPHGRLQAYAGVGPGVVIAHPENRIDNVENDEEYVIGGFGIQGFLGVKALIFRHLGVFGEYKFTHSDLEVDVDRGDAHVEENTHHLVFGLTVPF